MRFVFFDHDDRDGNDDAYGQGGMCGAKDISNGYIKYGVSFTSNLVQFRVTSSIVTSNQ